MSIGPKFNVSAVAVLWMSSLADTSRAQWPGDFQSLADVCENADLPNRSAFGLKRARLDGPLETDRPDFTESTSAIPEGWFQLEVGYTMTYDRQGETRVRDHTGPEVLLRMGLGTDLELRFGWTGYSFTNTTVSADDTPSVSEWSQGANDVEIGFKWHLREQSGWFPDLAFLGSMTTPSGSASTTAGDVEPTVGLIWAYDLSEELAVAGQVLLTVPTEDGHRFVQTAASLSLAVGLTDRWGTYAEYFGFYTSGNASADTPDAVHSLNGGFTYLVSDNFQIDIRAGFGLNEEADDFFAGAGFSWRF
jgi:outer membrane putative beta-barrel porin/alpha-amylase